MVLVAGCISADSEPEICTEWTGRCVGPEKQTCLENQWIKTGECEVPVEASEILEAPGDYEGKEFEIKGKVTDKDGNKLKIDDEIWIDCVSRDCRNTEVGEDVEIKSTTDYVKTYKISYTLPRTQSYPAERYELPHYTFPVSTEGAITSNACENLAEDYFVENGKSPTDISQYTLSYAAFYSNNKPTKDAYYSVIESLCADDEASFVSTYSEDMDYMWCAKILDGDYCYLSYDNFERGAWDWQFGDNIGKEKTDMSPYTKIEEVCDDYGGSIIQEMERHILKGIFAFKAPVCKIKIFEADAMINTTKYCNDLGGTVEDDECIVVDSKSKDECGNNNDVPEGGICYLRSKCYEKAGAFEYIDDDYYCTDPTGITKEGIFDSYDDNCLYGEITICNLKEYKIEEEIITEYLLTEV